MSRRFAWWRGRPEPTPLVLQRKDVDVPLPERTYHGEYTLERRLVPVRWLPGVYVVSHVARLTTDQPVRYPMANLRGDVESVEQQSWSLVVPPDVREVCNPYAHIVPHIVGTVLSARATVNNRMPTPTAATDDGQDTDAVDDALLLRELSEQYDRIADTDPPAGSLERRRMELLARAITLCHDAERIIDGDQ